MTTEFKHATRGRVLIADDNDDVRSLIAELLEWEGWQVSEARDGREALEKAIKQQPDVVVLDYRMPEYTGGQVCRALREFGVDIPIVLITADGNGKRLAAALGLRYFLEKPFKIPPLLAMLDRAVARR